MLPGFEPQPPAVDINPHLPQITARAETDCSKQHFERRQDGESAGTTTSNGIVFAQSSLTIGAIDPNLPAVTGVSTVTSVKLLATASPSGRLSRWICLFVGMCVSWKFVQSVEGGRISFALAGPVGKRRFTYLKVPVAWAHTRSCSS